MKVRFIVNPKAGTAGESDRAAEVTAAVREALASESGVFEIKVAAGSDSLARLSAEAVRNGYDAVYACGGDGTVNHVASPLVGTGTALGIIALGSGNALARALGIPTGVKEAVSLVKAFRTREIDAATMCNRRFFTTAGLGFEAHLSRRYNEGEWSGGVRGILPYVPLALSEFFGYRPGPVEIRAEAYNATVRPFLLTVANIDCLGGGTLIAPGASPDDGLLELCIVPRLHFPGALSLALKMLSGKVERFKGYTRVHTAWAEVIGKAPFTVHLDGEAFEWAGPVHISVEPKSLKILTR